eukprot:m.345896 g.345896  ORF g.345896 m.345896 type:complete len:56 (+) comp27534_c0_seq1:403-570(+)
MSVLHTSLNKLGFNFDEERCPRQQKYESLVRSTSFNLFVIALKLKYDMHINEYVM